ncbi:MAG: AsmA family protein, partial [Candidatus Rokubacteria bacterium]|nr:AsmA family protein [Candidatus Rokubacteria bacterium]
MARAGLALPFLVDLPRVKALIAGSAAQALGRPVKFASVSLSLLPLPAVELRGLEVAEDPAFGTAPFLKLDTGRLRLRLRPLLGGRVEFREVTLSAPRIALVQRADGRWNVASLGAAPEARGTARAPRAGGGSGAPGGGAPLLAARVSIQHGVVTYAPGAPGPAGSWRLEDLNLTLADGGAGSLAVAGTLRVMPGDLAVTITDGRIGGLNGGHGLLDAPLAARVSLDGRDVAPLVAALAGPAPAIAGPVKGTLTVSGTLGAPRATGTLALATVRLTRRSAACPEPQQRTLALTGLTLAPAWQDGRLTARPVTAGLGGGTIATHVTVTLARGARVDARVELKDLAIRALPVERVLVDFLCQGYAVAGPLDLTGALAFGAADPWNTLSGPGQLRIGPGRVVGAQALKLMDGVVRVGGAVSALLGADLPVALFVSPLEFDSI